MAERAEPETQPKGVGGARPTSDVVWQQRWSGRSIERNATSVTLVAVERFWIVLGVHFGLLAVFFLAFLGSSLFGDAPAFETVGDRLFGAGASLGGLAVTVPLSRMAVIRGATKQTIRIDYAKLTIIDEMFGRKTTRYSVPVHEITQHPMVAKANQETDEYLLFYTLVNDAIEDVSKDIKDFQLQVFAHHVMQFIWSRPQDKPLASKANQPYPGTLASSTVQRPLYE